MKQVVSFIKKTIFWFLIFGCVFQVIQSCKEEYPMNEIEVLKENTNFIINANPSYCTLIRDKDIKNEDGVIVSYDRIEVDDVVVRFSFLDELQEKESSPGSIEKSKTLVITAKSDDDIRMGDILKTKDGFIYKVKEICDITLGGASKEFCYKKTGRVEWLVL